MATATSYYLVPQERTGPLAPKDGKDELRTTREWKPGFWRRLPWSGVISLLAAIGLAAGAVAVALTSNGKELDYWVVDGYVLQPTVILSIFVTIANALVIYAFTLGATIHWWRKVFQGTTLGRLHSSYHYGSGVTAIFSSVTAFNAVAVAGIFMPILLADGPLFQRSLSVLQRSQITENNTTVALSPRPLLFGSTGIKGEAYPYTMFYHPLFAQALQGYTNRDPIGISNNTCSGECEAELVAAGWDIECHKSEEAYRLATDADYRNFADPSNSFSNGTARSNSSYHGPEISQVVFGVNIEQLQENIGEYSMVGDPDTQLSILLVTRYKSTLGLSGTMTNHTCQLRDALVRYPVVMRNNTMSLRPMHAFENRTESLVWRIPEFYDNSQMSGGSSGTGSHLPSTLGGFWLALEAAFNATATISPYNLFYSIASSSAVASQYLRMPNASAISTYDVSWDDPMSDMILMANELMFRAAYTMSSEYPEVAIIQGSFNTKGNLTSPQSDLRFPNMSDISRSVEQRVLVTATASMSVHTVHSGWLAGGFVVLCLACLAVCPTYWGWWYLGRPVSMSPLEIARAFDAPVFSEADANATGKDLKNAFGDKKFKFNPVDEPQEGRRIFQQIAAK